MIQTPRTLLLAAALCATAVFTDSVVAQPGKAPRIASATRPMVEFSVREADLASAVRHHDKPAIERLLAADFEFRSPNNADELARADWLAAPASGAEAELSGLAVHAFPTIAIVSFTRTVTSGAQAGTRAFVVDAWTRQGAGWQLLARYESALPSAMGNPADVAPTGKG